MLFNHQPDEGDASTTSTRSNSPRAASGRSLMSTIALFNISRALGHVIITQNNLPTPPSERRGKLSSLSRC